MDQYVGAAARWHASWKMERVKGNKRSWKEVHDSIKARRADNTLPDQHFAHAIMNQQLPLTVRAVLSDQLEVKPSVLDVKATEMLDVKPSPLHGPLEDSILLMPSYSRADGQFEVDEDAYDTDSVPQCDADLSTRSYFDCASNGIIDMYKLAEYLSDLHSNKMFNWIEYEEFIRSDVATQALQYCYDGLRNIQVSTLEDLIRVRRLDSYANQIRADILDAKFANLTQNASMVDRNRQPNVTSGFGIQNCTRQWILNYTTSPFIKMDLIKVASNWHEKRGCSSFQKITDLYRNILSKSTSPPQEIQRYSVRMNGKAGRNDRLRNVPQEIEETLIGFGEDVMGLGHPDLNAPPNADLSHSSFYAKLGSTEQERRKEYQKLVEERIRWRAELFRALQRALRDLRSYDYSVNEDGTNFVWIPSNRKSKRRTTEGQLKLSKLEGHYYDEEDIGV